MKIQRLYIDTSVVGGCFDAEFARWSNGLYEDIQRGIFIPVVSEVTAAEIAEAPEFVQQRYSEILDQGAEILTINEAAFNLADFYQERKILTPKYYDDGLHIALATINEVDLLVSWNFKHIVHYEKIRLFNAVHLELGYKSLQIYSPREVTFHGEELD